MKIKRTIIPFACLFLTFTGVEEARAATVTVDGTTVKTITEAIAKLNREDGDADHHQCHRSRCGGAGTGHPHRKGSHLDQPRWRW